MKNGLLLCLIFILFHASCQKTPPIIEPENITEDCVPLGNGWREWPGYIYGLHKPSFNPNNPDEFICIEQKAGLRLIKYNLKTKERKVVTDGRISMSAGVTGIPDWGVNDWILFEITREGMFKIKSNGDSLTRLTTRKWWYYYSWNPDGKYYIHDGIICNAQNEAIDTIEFRGGNWKYHPTLMIRNAGGLQIYDLELEKYTKTFPSPDSTGATTWMPIWLKDGKRIVWTTALGIYLTDTETAITTLIRSSCDGKVYHYCTYSPQSHKLLFSRTDCKRVNNIYITCVSRLFMINPDGSGEEEILIPFP